MHLKFPRLYALLKRHGHNPAKAVEILLDASRRDRHALQWIKTLHRCERRMAD